MFGRITPINYKRSHIGLRQGNVVGSQGDNFATDGTDTLFLTTEAIPGGRHFFLKVKRGYKIAYITYVMEDGYIYEKAAPNGEDLSGGAASPGQWYSDNETLLKNEGETDITVVVRDTATVIGGNGEWTRRNLCPIGAKTYITICKAGTTISGGTASGESITASDNCVEEFIIFDTVIMDCDSRHPLYKDGMADLRQWATLQWIALVAPVSAWTSAGIRKFGSNYSTHVWSDRVLSQFYISPKTYISATRNPRSLFYTEWLKSQGQYNSTGGQKAVSGYGLEPPSSITLATVMSGFGFGSVCNDCASTIFGLAQRSSSRMTEWYNSLYSDEIFKSTAGKTNIQLIMENRGWHSSNELLRLKSYDVCVSSGHIFVVVDTYKGSDGKVRFVKIAETTAQATNHTHLVVLPLSELCRKMANDDASRSYTVQRMNNAFLAFCGKFYHQDYDWLDSTGKADHVEPLVTNPDICTYKGDECEFATGEPVWINVKVNDSGSSTSSIYTGLRIYKKDGDSWGEPTEVAISEPQGGHNNNLGELGRWWDIDLSDYFDPQEPAYLGEGEYKVTAYNSDTETGGTIFEVVDFTISGYRYFYNISSKRGFFAQVMTQHASDGSNMFIKACYDNAQTTSPNNSNGRSMPITMGRWLWPGNTNGRFNVLVPTNADHVLAVRFYLRGKYGTAMKEVRLGDTGMDASAFKNLLSTQISDKPSYTNQRIKIENGIATAVSNSTWRLSSGMALSADTEYIFAWNDEYGFDTGQMVAQYLDNNGNPIASDAETVLRDTTTVEPLTHTTRYCKLSLPNGASKVRVCIPQGMLQNQDVALFSNPSWFDETV